MITIISFDLKSWHWIWNRTQLPRRLFVLVLFYDFKRNGERLNFVGQAWPCGHGLRPHLEAAQFFSDGTFTFYAVECSGWKLVRICFIVRQSCVCAWESCAYIRMICIYIYLSIYLLIHLFIYNISIYMHTCILIYTQYILLSSIQHLYNLVHASETPRWAFESWGDHRMHRRRHCVCFLVQKKRSAMHTVEGQKSCEKPPVGCFLKPS